MRGTVSRVLSCTLLATMLAAGAAGASPAPPGPDVRQVAMRGPELPEAVEGGVIVDLPDGDRFKVWHSRDLTTVHGQRYDAATGAWGAPTVLLRERGVECEQVDARSSAGAVAVMAQCYRLRDGDLVSHVLYSPDTVAWVSHEIDAGFGNEPGISPDGRAAVWSLREGYLTWTAAEGFVERAVEVEGETYNATATIADDGTVSFLYPVEDPGGVNCRVEIATRLGDGPVARQTVVPDTCFLPVYDLVNADALTVHFGPGSAAYQSVLTRPDTASGWAVTSRAPAYAPGLRLHAGRTHTRFFTPPGLPLVALGSADHRTFEVQQYDEAAQRWSAPRPVVRMDRRCRWDPRDIDSDDLAVMVEALRCKRRQSVLVSGDGSAWYDVTLHRPLMFSAGGQWVSTSTRRSTTVFSQEEGRVRIPLGASRPCDAVIPASPSTAVRLTTSRVTGWPSVLQRSTPTGWRRTETTVPRAPANDTCRRVGSEPPHVRPATYIFSGDRTGMALTVVPRGDGWAVRRSG